MYTWFSVGYILEDCRSCKSLPWSQFTDPSDDPLIQEGLNLCFGKIIEVETARTSDGNTFVKTLHSWYLASLIFHSSELRTMTS